MAHPVSEPDCAIGFERSRSLCLNPNPESICGRLDCSMVHDSTGFSLENITAGQAQMAYVMKVLVDKANPALFELLDLNDDRIFLEPLLFAYFNSPSPLVSLEQILFGYIENDRKPGVEAYADENGIVNVPGIGDLRTTYPNERLRLSWDDVIRACVLEFHDGRVDFELQSPRYLEGSNIEICRYNHPLLKRFYTSPDGNALDVEVIHSIDHFEKLNKTLRIVENCCPSYFHEIMAVAKRIVVFRNYQVRPFVTISAHGTVFLSGNEKSDELFFLAEIIHQFGHNILNAVLFETSDYFRIDPRTPIANYTLSESDHRTILSAFHGLYTTTKIAECFDIIFDKNIFHGKQRHELLGRLADNADRTTTGFEQLDRSTIFTEQGEFMYQRMKEICHDIYARRADLLAPLDTSNQPFVFDYDLFLQRNALTELQEHE